ncbi:unnamed protein product [Heligmosomoides polygyrus]|uniref:Uncharacterized protein n=1 Tax=Heligmosomoides polygyrus TaxID=6339 RepID=A0A183GAS7_HELPZ|nr:unnamed protein product [Heligmosomoides polygyrus]
MLKKKKKKKKKKTKKKSLLRRRRLSPSPRIKPVGSDPAHASSLLRLRCREEQCEPFRRRRRRRRMSGVTSGTCQGLQLGTGVRCHVEFATGSFSRELVELPTVEWKNPKLKCSFTELKQLKNDLIGFQD